MTARGDSTTVAIARDVHWLRLRGANVYFVRSGETWVLVDAGFPGSGRTIAEAAGRLCGGGRPAAIVLTHGHPDHAGSAVELGAEWGVPVLAPAREMPFIDGTALYPEPLVAALARVLPRRAMEALVRGSDLGDSVRSFDPDAGVPGLPEWVCVPTPGHTPGHTALFRPADKTLIAGDAVLTMAWSSRLGGRGAGWIWDLARGRTRLTGPPTLVTCDWEAAAASIGTLAGLEPWLLATGHGSPIAGPRVAPALRAFAARCLAENAGPIRAAAGRPVAGSLVGEGLRRRQRRAARHVHQEQGRAQSGPAVPPRRPRHAGVLPRPHSPHRPRERLHGVLVGAAGRRPLVQLPMSRPSR